MWYASEMAAKVIGMAGYVFAPHQGGMTYCTFCGRPINPGDPVEDVSGMNEFFSDTRALATYSGVSCAFCSVVRSKDNMFKLMRCVVTPYAIYPIAKDVHKAWLLLTPPDPPFAAMIGTSTLQHLVWRTPVTMSRHLIYIRLGQKVVFVRPQVVAEAKEIVVKYPGLVLLDREMKSSAFGINPKVGKLLSSEERQLIKELSVGELWALSILATKKSPVPEAPLPLS